MNKSPYNKHHTKHWPEITESLICRHPLTEQEIVCFVQQAWQDISVSEIGGLKFGRDILPSPQFIGNLLHALIPAKIAAAYPKYWRKELNAEDKDIVYIPDDFFSIELKTSSSSGQIYGNRSYAQKPTNDKKGKDGYYLAVNFGKFSNISPNPELTKIRFGWLDHTDWIGQTAQTGQQARLSPETYQLKFKTLFSKGQLPD